MLKDAQINIAENIALGISPEDLEVKEKSWNVYLFNLSDYLLEGVLVSSRGYGMHKNEQVETSRLRHFLDLLAPQSYQIVEPIMEQLFGLNNQYWVSYYLDGKMYEKKYIILPDAIREENFTELPIIKKRGILLR